MAQPLALGQLGTCAFHCQSPSLFFSLQSIHVGTVITRPGAWADLVGKLMEKV